MAGIVESVPSVYVFCIGLAGLTKPALSYIVVEIVMGGN